MPEEKKEYLIKCPHCKKESKLSNGLIKRLQVYLERFRDDFKEIKALSNSINIEYIIDKILKGF